MTKWDSSRNVYIAKITNLRYGCKFVSTNDDLVWKDTPKQKSVDSAFYGRDDMAKTIPYEYVSNVEWTPVEIISGYQARLKNKPDNVMYGDTPFEAVSYLEFSNEYEIERDPITKKSTIQDQIKHILRYHTGSVHYSTINNYTNSNQLNNEYDNSEIKEILKELSNESGVYTTKQGEDWWSIRI